MKKSFVFISILILLLAFIVSCSKGGSGAGGDGGTGGSGGGGGGGTNIDCTNVPKTFASNVNPLIQSFCNQSACHDATSSNGVGPLTNYAQVSNSSASIRVAIASGTMPQNTTLSTAQKNTIICWIDAGAQNN